MTANEKPELFKYEIHFKIHASHFLKSDLCLEVTCFLKWNYKYEYFAFLRVSPKTLLTFCTSGVLLRTLMTGDASLTTVTHVIVVGMRIIQADSI